MNRNSATFEAVQRRLPQGAELGANGGAHFRVWAPKRRRVEVDFLERDGHTPTGQQFELQAEGGGYFSATVRSAAAGDWYAYRLDGESPWFADPASRFQPLGPDGPSEIIDPQAFAWTDAAWPGVRLQGQVAYEMHVGTFTPEGTWRAAAEQLPELADLGVTLLEVMPIGDWAGEFGWGYDGVNLFAPTRLYGAPDDLRHFVDRAHSVGIGVALDVVYNHFGELGAHFREFSDDYFAACHANEWGDAINFDQPHSEPVRDFFVSNARYWIEEFHLDGFRIDATQAFCDDSPQHILAQITVEARRAAGQRSLVIVGESEPQDVTLVRPLQRGGYGMDGVWNDDFHHSAMVRLTGHNEAYYSDYLGSADEFVSALKWGYLYQGQRYRWQKKPRGTPTFGLPGRTFFNYLQNHDQIANSAAGERVHRLTSPGRLRAMTALLLLGPGTPLLFQGQEFAASTPFLYFLDNPPERAKIISVGRGNFLKQFPSLALDEVQRRLPEPSDLANFERCKLDFSEREKHAEVYLLHKDLLKLRREDPLVNRQRADRLDGAALSPDALVVRFFGDEEAGTAGEDRLLLVNFGRDLHLDPAPQPLLAPPLGRNWQVCWSSEDPAYGGAGTAEPYGDENWRLPGEAALLLRSIALVP